VAITANKRENLIDTAAKGPSETTQRCAYRRDRLIERSTDINVTPRIARHIVDDLPEISVFANERKIE
jgi:hypothetical protein